MGTFDNFIPPDMEKTCPQCGKAYTTYQEYEEHIAYDHVGKYGGRNG